MLATDPNKHQFGNAANSKEHEVSELNIADMDPEEIRVNR
jgi:hypothetical protein